MGGALHRMLSNSQRPRGASYKSATSLRICAKAQDVYGFKASLQAMSLYEFSLDIVMPEPASDIGSLM